ncbi:NAD(P)-dependent malic enzyme [Haloglycomyces albus]|uniref:NAD(P)-dependent malic enzyme n=1 Tax=Haloglycomyces albus TaxID=526067 RepID=UPI001FE0C2F0|nr:NADP-dependent malic enzyme [Haloglycomyces albus]
MQKRVFNAHRGGKIRTQPTVELETGDDLSLAYTPGVAQVSEAIAADQSLADTYTWRSNTVAVVTDGSAVLGLGDIGPAASLPVMEGKSALFQKFAGVDSIPICLNINDVDEIVASITAIAPSFGGINLEDIAAPRCFDIERRLDAAVDIPVFHDDQHGTAIVALAALHNALKLQGRKIGDITATVVGAGAAGTAITKVLNTAGIGDIVVCDSQGIITRERSRLSGVKRELAEISNRGHRSGGIDAALEASDVLIGVSGAAIPPEALRGMNSDAIIFAMANPTPEVDPEVARAHADIVATGRSDYPNQINNVLAFPGIFRGALDAGATTIDDRMKLAAAYAIADAVGSRLSPSRIVPSPLEPAVASSVAAAVKGAAQGTS